MYMILVWGLLLLAGCATDHKSQKKQNVTNANQLSPAYERLVQTIY